MAHKPPLGQHDHICPHGVVAELEHGLYGHAVIVIACARQGKNKQSSSRMQDNMHTAWHLASSVHATAGRLS